MMDDICPIDASHTEHERRRIVRRMNRPEVNWNDPMTQAYGQPEGYK